MSPSRRRRKVGPHVGHRAVRMLDARARLRAKRRVGARDDHRDDDRVVVAMDGRHRHFGRATSTREHDGRPRRRGRDDDAERARPAADDGVSPNRRRARLDGYHRERTHGTGAREDVRIVVDVVVTDTFSSSASKHRRHGDAAFVYCLFISCATANRVAICRARVVGSIPLRRRGDASLARRL